MKAHSASAVLTLVPQKKLLQGFYQIFSQVYFGVACSPNNPALNPRIHLPLPSTRSLKEHRKVQKALYLTSFPFAKAQQWTPVSHPFSHHVSTATPVKIPLSIDIHLRMACISQMFLDCKGKKYSREPQKGTGSNSWLETKLKRASGTLKEERCTERRVRNWSPLSTKVHLLRIIQCPVSRDESSKEQRSK